MNRHHELINLIQEGIDPYASFPADQWNHKWVEWGSNHPWFKESIELVKPRTIIEVGTFTGASAIHMADILNSMQMDASIICVDTFLGGIDHWLNARHLLGSQFGRPSIYYEFLANVLTHNHESRIIPLPLDSINAARFLAASGVTCQMIYVDGSHEEEDVSNDLNHYWPLLEPGGIILLDDLTGHFRGLIRAVEAFVEEHGITLTTNLEKGRIIKP